MYIIRYVGTYIQVYYFTNFHNNKILLLFVSLHWIIFRFLFIVYQSSLMCVKRSNEHACVYLYCACPLEVNTDLTTFTVAHPSLANTSWCNYVINIIYALHVNKILLYLFSLLSALKDRSIWYVHHYKRLGHH